MRLQHFINEQDSPEQAEFDKSEEENNDEILRKAAVHIKGRAREWVTAVKNCKQKIIWRGVVANSGAVVKTVRKDRKPTDMPLETHRRMDSYFNDKFGWPARSAGLFASPKLESAYGYGDEEYMIFPIKYKSFIYSPSVYDLYPKKHKWDDLKDTYTDKNLCKALSSSNEMMIRADKYYGVNRWILINSSWYKKGGGDTVAGAANRWFNKEVLGK